MYIYLYTHFLTCSYVKQHLPTHIHTYTHTHTYTHKRIHTHTHTHTHIHTVMHIHIHTCILSHAHTNIHPYVPIAACAISSSNNAISCFKGAGRHNPPFQQRTETKPCTRTAGVKGARRELEPHRMYRLLCPNWIIIRFVASGPSVPHHRHHCHRYPMPVVLKGLQQLHLRPSCCRPNLGVHCLIGRPLLQSRSHPDTLSEANARHHQRPMHVGFPTLL